jgi:hypothetical protein
MARLSHRATLPTTKAAVTAKKGALIIEPMSEQFNSP